MRLKGTKAADQIHGAAQDDTINGMRGDDQITGEGGSDKINGGDGADTLYGDEAPTWSYSFPPLGAPGDDTLDGGAGADALFGGEGKDLLNGGDGADYIDGGGGDDLLVGEAGGDQMYGGAGSDTYQGGAGDDSYSEPDSYYDGPYYPYPIEPVPPPGPAVPAAGIIAAPVVPAAESLPPPPSERDMFVFEAPDGPGGFGFDSVVGFEPGQDQLRFVGYTEADLARPVQAAVTEGYTYTDPYDPTYSYSEPDQVYWQFDFQDGSRVFVSFYDEVGVPSTGAAPVAGQDYVFA